MKEALQKRRERVTLTVLSALLVSPNHQRVSSYELAKKAVKQADAIIKELDLALAPEPAQAQKTSFEFTKGEIVADLTLEGECRG